jgi:hypothetical protein
VPRTEPPLGPAWWERAGEPGVTPR